MVALPLPARWKDAERCRPGCSGLYPSGPALLNSLLHWPFQWSINGYASPGVRAYGDRPLGPDRKSSFMRSLGGARVCANGLPAGMAQGRRVLMKRSRGLALFVVGWIFQFVGHFFEGKPPEFFKDPRFLLVGLRWWYAL